MAHEVLKGILWDKRANQFTARVGYALRPDGVRTRSFQYLGAGREDAMLRHLATKREWAGLKAIWPRLREVLTRFGPPHVRAANLGKPIWIKREWAAPMEAEARLHSQENLAAIS